MLLPNGPPGPKLLLQRVPEPKTIKNNIHLDTDAEATRLEHSALEVHIPTRSTSTAPTGSS